MYSKYMYVFETSSYIYIYIYIYIYMVFPTIPTMVATIEEL